MWKTLLNGKFRCYLAGQVLILSAISASSTLLVLWTFKRFESTPLIGLASSAIWGVAAIVGIYAGVIADRVSQVSNTLRKVVLVGLMLSLTACLSTLFLKDYLLLLILILLVVLLQVVNGFISALAFVIIPTLLDKKEIAAGQALITSVGVVANVATPIISAWFVSTDLLGVGFLVQGGLMGLAWLCYSVIDVTLTRVLERQKFHIELMSGWTELWSNILMRQLTIAGFMNALTGGVLPIVYLELSQRRFGLTPDSVYIAGFAVMATVGSVIGNMALPFLRNRFSAHAIAKGALVGVSITLLLFAFSPAVIIAMLVYALWQMFYGLVVINAIAYRMEVVPSELLGRVGTLARLIAWGASPIAALVVGFASKAISSETICLVAAVLPMIGVVMLYKVSKRERCRNEES